MDYYFGDLIYEILLYELFTFFFKILNLQCGSNADIDDIGVQ